MAQVKIPEEDSIEILKLPHGRIRAVLDTDAYNEIDDQFAIVYALLSPENIDLEAIYAAPFFNSRSTSAADGMEKSYKEIDRLLRLMGMSCPTFKGSRDFISNTRRVIPSPAVTDLITRASQESSGPLYVLAIGAITNIASAIETAPDIADKIVVVWLGGHANHWPDNEEFNLRQDPDAVRIILESEVPFVRIPCVPVADHLLTTEQELESYLKGQSPLCDYLCRIFSEFREHEGAWSKVIWDISVVAWLINPEWVPTEIVRTPTLTKNNKWRGRRTRHPMRQAVMVDRDAVFTDLFTKLSTHS
jgi:purine nucleosidase